MHTSLKRPELLKHYARKWLDTDLTGFDAIRDRSTTRLEQLSCEASIPVAMAFLGSVVEDWEARRAAEGAESVDCMSTFSNGALYSAFVTWYSDTRGASTSLTKLLFLFAVEGGLGMENKPLVSPSGPIEKLPIYWDSVEAKSARGFRIDYAALGVWLRAKSYLAAAEQSVVSAAAAAGFMHIMNV